MYKHSPFIPFAFSPTRRTKTGRRRRGARPSCSIPNGGSGKARVQMPKKRMKKTMKAWITALKTATKSEGKGMLT